MGVRFKRELELTREKAVDTLDEIQKIRQLNAQLNKKKVKRSQVKNMHAGKYKDEQKLKVSSLWADIEKLFLQLFLIELEAELKKIEEKKKYKCRFCYFRSERFWNVKRHEKRIHLKIKEEKLPNECICDLNGAQKCLHSSEAVEDTVKSKLGNYKFLY